MAIGDEIRARREANGLSQTELAKAVGISQAAIDKIENGKTQRSRFLPQILAKLGLPQALLFAEGSAPPQSEVSAPVPLTPLPQQGGRPDLAVRGIALGGKEGDGDFQLNGDALQYIERPAGLINRPEAFAVIIRNTSMEPVYKHGWPIFVDPKGRKPVEGEDVLVELHGDDGEPGAAFIKTLVAKRGGQVVLTQYNNPPSDGLRFPADRVKQILRVIPYVEAMGLSV